VGKRIHRSAAAAILLAKRRQCFNQGHRDRTGSMLSAFFACSKKVAKKHSRFSCLPAGRDAGLPSLHACTAKIGEGNQAASKTFGNPVGGRNNSYRLARKKVNNALIFQWKKAGIRISIEAKSLIQLNRTIFRAQIRIAFHHRRGKIDSYHFLFRKKLAEVAASPPTKAPIKAVTRTIAIEEPPRGNI